MPNEIIDTTTTTISTPHSSTHTMSDLSDQRGLSNSSSQSVPSGTSSLAQRRGMQTLIVIEKSTIPLADIATYDNGLESMDDYCKRIAGQSINLKRNYIKSGNNSAFCSEVLEFDKGIVGKFVPNKNINLFMSSCGKDGELDRTYSGEDKIEAEKYFTKQLEYVTDISKTLLGNTDYSIATPTEITALKDGVLVIMPKARGKSISDIISQKDHKSIDILKIAKNLFSVLGAMQQSKVEHGDLNIGNIFIDTDGHVTLIDTLGMTTEENIRLDTHPDDRKVEDAILDLLAAKYPEHKKSEERSDRLRNLGEVIALLKVRMLNKESSPEPQTSVSEASISR
jgi:hypothetical protein